MRSTFPAARLGALLALVLLCGCAQSVPPPPPTDPPTSAASSSPGAGATVQRRLADALRAEGDPGTAELVEDRSTTVSVVPAGWLPGWQVLDVLNRGVPHGRRFFVGLADDGRTQHLAGHPEAFGAMVAAAGVDVTDPSTATAVAQLFVDATRTFEHYAYRVEGVDDIAWLPHPSGAEQAARRRLTRRYRSQILPPVARPVPEGCRLALWTVDDRALVGHAITVTRRGEVSSTSRTVEADLPVPTSR